MNVLLPDIAKTLARGPHAASFSWTVSANTIVPTAPTPAAATKGSEGARFQRSPPVNAAGAIAELRTR
jgi:hypothetical protein